MYFLITLAIICHTCNQTSVSKPFDLVCVLTKIADKSNQNEARDIVCGCDYPEILTGHREAFLDSRDVLRQITGCKRWTDKIVQEKQKLIQFCFDNIYF